MAMNKSKGNMYDFVNFTWNTINGKCPHNCSYCYNQDKPFFEGELRLNEKNLNDNLGSGNYIFVGSSNDLFANKVPTEWILKTIEHCRKFDNTYLFQTKNPKRFLEFEKEFPEKTYLGITLETNRSTLEISKAPLPMTRVADFCKLNTNKTMLSLEPILNFDPDIFLASIQLIRPEFVSIGVDSKGHRLNEPTMGKIQELIKELEKFTNVKIKDNLKRLK